MNLETVCPPDCPARSATCHAFCRKYLAAWEENQRRYAAQAEQRKVDEIIGKSVRESYRKIGRRAPEY